MSFNRGAQILTCPLISSRKINSIFAQNKQNFKLRHLVVQPLAVPHSEHAAQAAKMIDIFPTKFLG
jgi:hypothetical protein